MNKTNLFITIINLKFRRYIRCHPLYYFPNLITLYFYYKLFTEYLKSNFLYRFLLFLRHPVNRYRSRYNR